MSHLGSLILLGSLTLLGCKFGSHSGTAVDIAATSFTPGGFLQLSSKSGVSITANFGTLSVRLVPPGTSSPTPVADDSNLAPPGHIPTFSKAYLTVSAPGVLDAPMKGSFPSTDLDDASRSKTAAISRLPELANGTLRVYLTGTKGELVGAGVVDGVSIHRGTNTVDVPITPNDSQPELLGASDSINVSDNVIVKGAKLTLKSGFAQATPGVSRVEIEISGAAYGDGTEQALIASLEAPSLDDYEWLPINSSSNYVASKLVTSDKRNPFRITSRAIDPYGTVVAHTDLALSVVGTAYVDVNVDNGSGSSGAGANSSATAAADPGNQ